MKSSYDLSGVVAAGPVWGAILVIVGKECFVTHWSLDKLVLFMSCYSHKESFLLLLRYRLTKHSPKRDHLAQPAFRTHSAM